MSKIIPEENQKEADLTAQSNTPANRTSKNVALVICTLSSLISTYMASAVNVALPTINNEFHANTIVLSWVATISLVAVAVFLLPVGRISDIVGIKRILSLGIAVFAVSSIAAALAHSVVMLLVCMVCQGIGRSMIFANGIAMISAVFPAKERGRAIGLNVAAVYIGLSIGPLIGGLLSTHLGWRSIYYAVVPLCLITLLLIYWQIKDDWRAAKGEKFDYSGSFIYGISLVSLMYGFSVLPDTLGFILVAAGILVLVIFFNWENRRPSPILNTAVFRGNRVFVMSNLTALISYSAVYAIIFILSLYLQYIQGFNADKAGLVLLVQPVTQAIVAPFAGRLSDRIEPQIVASVGMGLTFLGLLSLAFLSNTTSIILIIITLIVLGAGFGLFSSPNTNAIMGSVVPKFYGVASASVGTMRNLGQMFSMGITMIVLTLVVGRVEMTPQSYPAFLTATQVAFSIFSILSLVGIFTSLVRGKMREKMS